MLLPPNTPIANDRKSIRESWAGLLGPNTAVSWKASKVEVAKSGELGYLYGTYQLSIKDPNRETFRPPAQWLSRLLLLDLLSKSTRTDNWPLVTPRPYLRRFFPRQWYPLYPPTTFRTGYIYFCVLFYWASGGVFLFDAFIAGNSFLHGNVILGKFWLYYALVSFQMLGAAIVFWNTAVDVRRPRSRAGDHSSGILIIAR